MKTIFPIHDKKILINRIKLTHHNLKIDNISYKKISNIKTNRKQNTSVMMFKDSIDAMYLHITKKFIIQPIKKLNCLILLKKIINKKLEDIIAIKKKNVFSISALDSCIGLRTKDDKAYIVSFLSKSTNFLSNVHGVLKQVIHYPIELIQSKFDNIGFINKSVYIAKNIFLLNHNIKVFFHKKIYNDIILYNIKKIIHNKVNFFETIKNKFILKSFKVNDIFYNVKKDSVKCNNYSDYNVKSDFIYLKNNMKSISWVALNLMNQLSSTTSLSQKIFDEAKEINNRLRHIKLPLHNNIIIDNTHLNFSLRYHALNDLKKYIPDTYLRNLILSCFQQDLTSKPCLNVFYNTKEINQFTPEQSSVLYAIDTFQNNQVKFTVTYLGRLIKNANAITKKNYTTFGARTSIILSKDTLPEIKYFNFIH